MEMTTLNLNRRTMDCGKAQMPGLWQDSDKRVTSSADTDVWNAGLKVLLCSDFTEAGSDNTH